MATYHRHAEITENNHGPLVNIAAWTLMVTSILFTTFRLISNVVIRGGVGKDDWIIVAATALAVGQTAATSMMVDNGLGQHQSELSPAMIQGYQKVRNQMDANGGIG